MQQRRELGVVVLVRHQAWGVLRHYWVAVKLGINVVATIVLLLYLQTLGYLAGVAVSGADLSALRSPSAVVHAGAAVLLLLVATTLSVYKPRGLTRYGQRQQQRALVSSARAPDAPRSPVREA